MHIIYISTKYFKGKCYHVQMDVKQIYFNLKELFLFINDSIITNNNN